MQYAQIMQGPQPPHNLHKQTPNLLLLKGGAFLLVFDDSLVEVSVIGILHDNPT